MSEDIRKFELTEDEAEQASGGTDPAQARLRPFDKKKSQLTTMEVLPGANNGGPATIPIDPDMPGQPVMTLSGKAAAGV